MPPKTRSEAGPRPAASPSASPRSSGDCSHSLPGDASPDDNLVSALRRDLALQHAAHREEAAELRLAVVAMNRLMQSMAVLPQAAPVIAPTDVLAALMSRMHETSLADQADRRAALDEARLARRDAAARAEAAATARLG